MTTITSLAQALNTSTSLLGQSSTSSTSTSDTLASAQKSSTTTSTSGGDTVTLSASAQALLSKLTQKNYGFTLTAKQQEQIQAVLTKYKSEPQTQETYDKIQKDLKKLRLDTATLAAKESAKSFSMKGLMQSIISGNTTASETNATESKKTIALKKDQYARQLVSDWSAIIPKTTSTTATTA
jgi:hypothetical protein